MMICTRCDKHNADKGRLSRRDNKTSICRYCELEEQAVDHMVFSENTVPRKGMGKIWDAWKRDAAFQILLGPTVAVKFASAMVRSTLGVEAAGELTDEQMGQFILEINEDNVTMEGGD